MFTRLQHPIEQTQCGRGVPFGGGIDRVPHRLSSPTSNGHANRFNVKLSFIVHIQRQLLQLLVHPTELAIGQFD